MSVLRALQQYVIHNICARVHGVEVFLRPLFDGWLRSLLGEDTDDGLDWWEVRAEIAA